MARQDRREDSRDLPDLNRTQPTSPAPVPAPAPAPVATPTPAPVAAAAVPPDQVQQLIKSVTARAQKAPGASPYQNVMEMLQNQYNRASAARLKGPTTQQQQAYKLLAEQATGQGPSIAALQAQQQADQIAQQQIGMAQARGGANPAAMRAAILAGQQAQSAAGGQAAMARAQEIIAARQALGGQAESMAQTGLQQQALQAQQQQALMGGLLSAAGGQQQFGLQSRAMTDEGYRTALQAAMGYRGQDLGTQEGAAQRALQLQLGQMQAQQAANALASQEEQAKWNRWTQIVGGILGAGATLGAAAI